MIESLVEQIEGRFAELERQMSDPAVIADRERYAEVGREYRELEPAHELAREYARLRDDLEGARELLAEDGDDPELRKLVADAPARLEELGEQIRLAMVERDPNDDKNVLVEIRAGTGGDEAALFAGDLFKMLTALRGAARLRRPRCCRSRPPRSAASRRSPFAVKGDGAYSVFKYEGGPTACSGCPRPSRRGGSTPRPPPWQCCPRPRRWRWRSTPATSRWTSIAPPGPAASRVNTTDSAVRMTHKPTGIVVSMQDEKSQLQNREKAMRVLRARLYEQKLAEQQAEIASERRSQVGSGERSEKIRTYNFPQGRVTDHRVKLTAHDLDQVLAGDLRRVHRGARWRGEAATPRGAGRRSGVLMSPGAGAGAVREALAAASDALAAAGVEDARLDAELLLAEATGWDRARLAARARGARSTRAPPGASARWCGAASVASRSRTSSAARAFARLELAVDRRALIPRPETELLVEIALELEPGTALDVGTGSGAVALAVADELPDCEVTGTDTSTAALDLARENAERLGIDGRVRFEHGTVPEGGRFELVLANLPYVRDDEWEGLAPEITRYEPREALVAGADGVEAIASTVPATVAGLEPGASLALEVGAGQAGPVAELLLDRGFGRVEGRQDLAGIRPRGARQPVTRDGLDRRRRGRPGARGAGALRSRGRRRHLPGGHALRARLRPVERSRDRAESTR